MKILEIDEDKYTTMCVLTVELDSSELEMLVEIGLNQLLSDYIENQEDLNNG